MDPGEGTSSGYQSNSVAEVQEFLKEERQKAAKNEECTRKVTASGDFTDDSSDMTESDLEEEASKGATIECYECKLGFRRLSDLRRHMDLHSFILPQPEPPRPRRGAPLPTDLTCLNCNETFDTKPQLVEHKRHHWRIRCFACKKCRKIFIKLLVISSKTARKKEHRCPNCKENKIISNLHNLLRLK